MDNNMETLGDKLYMAISEHCAGDNDLAAKLTGMLMDACNEEDLNLYVDDEQMLLPILQQARDSLKPAATIKKIVIEGNQQGNCCGKLLYLACSLAIWNIQSIIINSVFTSVSLCSILCCNIFVINCGIAHTLFCLNKYE